MSQNRSVDILNRLESEVGLKVLMEKYIISWNTIYHRDIYNEFDTFIKMGYKVEQAVLNTADKLGIDRSTVYKAKKRMES